MTLTIDLFRNETDTVRFKAGEVVFRAGDPGDAMYVVVDGEVNLHIRGQLVEAVGPGGVIGEMAMVERAPRIATATAVLDAELVAIPEQRFLRMVQETPHFALQILRVVVERLRRMDERL